MVCWGFDYDGAATPPAAVNGTTGTASAIAAGADHSMAIQAPKCGDHLDNDGDTLIDYPDDPGCFAPATNIEDPKCQDGIDNDGDGKIDFDGGLSALGYVATAPDPQCDDAWQMREAPIGSWRCGLSAELALLLLPVMWLYRRRSRRV
jgi:hypothetical protein